MELGDSGTTSGPLARFCDRLNRIQVASGISRASLAGAAHLGTSQMSDILNGKIKRLPDWDVTIAVVRACLEYAGAKDRPVPPDLRDEGDWRRRYADLEHDLDSEARSRPRLAVLTGWLLADVTDPFALEVHRPAEPDTPQGDLPALPVYLPREHDVKLERVVAAAVQGSSGIAVLVGGSSTGKTRACWEALRLLRGQPKPWRLWHPIDPARPEAALRELPSIGPRTVVWLNEAQFYLDVTADGLGERIAAGLREVLRDPARAPVLVLATLWPQYWDALTARAAARADLHAQARELLARRDISVPAAFTADQLRQLPAAGDPRLAWAAEAAENGQVIQFLAGAPELMARYHNAPPAAAALINAAIDARRLGMGIMLPLAFLEAAAPGYLTDTEWDGLGEEWLEQALAYTAAPCKGIRGPLARIRPRSISGVVSAPEPTYRLADYLEQHGRHARRLYIPSTGFWTAAGRFASPDNLPALARAAEDRGLLRDAARFRKRATAYGNTSEAAVLVQHWRSLYPHSADYNPARWAAAHAALSSPADVASLLEALLVAGAEEQAAALLDRDPAAHAALSSPADVAWLLEALLVAGAEEQAASLAGRAADHSPVDNPDAVARLLDVLQRVGTGEHAAALASRAAEYTPVENPYAVARLLGAVRRAGTEEQAAALAGRATHTTHAHSDNRRDIIQLLATYPWAGTGERAPALAGRATHHDNPYEVAWLLDVLWWAEGQAAAVVARDHGAHGKPGDTTQLVKALRKADTEGQVAVLAARAVADAHLDNPYEVARLLNALRGADADEQVAALIARDPAAVVALDNAQSVGWLLAALRQAGADEQVAALIARDPAAVVALDNPDGVARLLAALRQAGADEQVAALIARDPAAVVALDNPDGVARLLAALRKAGIEKQARTLLNRLPAEGWFGDFLEHANHRMRYRFGRESDGSPAAPWGWDDLD
jgi:uncharacterized protein YidB (DUF937 family)